jgi:hypothetical protein
MIFSKETTLHLFLDITYKDLLDNYWAVLLVSPGHSITYRLVDLIASLA